MSAMGGGQQPGPQGGGKKSPYDGASSEGGRKVNPIAQESGAPGNPVQ